MTRLYTRRDRSRLKLILLGRRIGFSLRDVKQIIDLYDPAGANVRQLKLVARQGRAAEEEARTAALPGEQAEAELDLLLRRTCRGRITSLTAQPAVDATALARAAVRALCRHSALRDPVPRQRGAGSFRLPGCLAGRGRSARLPAAAAVSRFARA